MKNKENQALWTAFRLLGPLLFYELCTEAVGVACSLFGTQNALTVTGGGAFLALPFLYAAYRKRQAAEEAQKRRVPLQNIDPTQRAGRVPCTGQQQRRRHLFAGCVCSALAGIGACLCLNVLLQFLLPPSDGWDSTRETVYGASLAVQVLVTVVFAPLTEEVLFRGLIRTELRTHMKPRAAALLGACCLACITGILARVFMRFFWHCVWNRYVNGADVCFRQCFCTREPTGQPSVLRLWSPACRQHPGDSPLWPWQQEWF